MNTHDLFVLLDYVSVLVMIASIVILSTHSSSRMQKYAIFVTGCLTMCCLGFLFRAEATNVEAYLTGQKLIYAFVTHGMFLMLLFILEYCKFSIPKRVENFFHIINLMISLVVLTLDYHSLFYKRVWEVTVNGNFGIEKEYGFMHTIAVGLFVLYMVSAVVIAIIFTVKNIRRRSVYVWRLLVAVMLPCISYLIPKITGIENDFQPMAFALSTLMVLYMIYKNNLYDINNIAERFSLASIQESLIVFDANYRYKGCNSQAEVLFPVLRDVELDSDIRKESELITNLLDGKIEEYELDDKFYDVAVRPIVDRGLTQGKVVRLEDVTLQHNYLVTLTNYSYTDDLTGISNRRRFEEVVTDIRENVDIADVVVGTVDLNELKQVNDSLCHSAGDELIKATATILTEVFEGYGRVFRTGGDEFYVLMTSVPNNLDELISKLVKRFDEWHGSLVDNLSASYGFVLGRDDTSTNIDKLLIDADMKMYDFKRNYYMTSGRDRRKN